MSLVQLKGTVSSGLNVEQAVSQRYSAASQEHHPALCCSVEYNADYLRVLPQELIDRDYGCGDPSRHVGVGETVLDLGSGGGKICYIASQIVGANGRVWGVDMNDDMLALARRYQPEITQRIGWDNVTFFKGRIQDLALDLDRFEQHLRTHPIHDLASWTAAETLAQSMRVDQPMIASDSVDVVLSNCVLNLVTPAARDELFAEIFRVLKRGGRAVISDIVCDEVVPDHLRNDPELWSGCISGAFVEHKLLEAFERAGFHGIEILERQTEPWATVEGIEFRSLTVRAYKGKAGPCLDHRQAVIYRGPWRSVTDDDGHVLRRGERAAVCEKTFRLYTSAPYAEDLIPVPPYQPVSPEEAIPFDCARPMVRDPRETKGIAYQGTSLPGETCCGPGPDC